MMSHYSEVCVHFENRPPPPKVIIAWRFYCCGFNKHISALWVTQLLQTIVEVVTSVERWYKFSLCSRNRVSHFLAYQPPGENIQPHLSRLPQCGQVRRIDDPPPFASPVELPRGHGDEARSFPCCLQKDSQQSVPMLGCGSPIVLIQRSEARNASRCLDFSISPGRRRHSRLPLSWRDMLFCGVPRKGIIGTLSDQCPNGHIIYARA
jgi:hypothetical protein